MNREQLEEIRSRSRRYTHRRNTAAEDFSLLIAAALSADDVPALLNEIDRLNIALGACQTALNHHLEVCSSDVLGSASALRANGRCPTCDSPEPRLHPATQEEGEVVAVCRDPYHGGPSGEEAS